MGNRLDWKILSETDMERLSVWLKAAARAGSEEDFLASFKSQYKKAANESGTA